MSDLSCFIFVLFLHGNHSDITLNLHVVGALVVLKSQTIGYSGQHNVLILIIFTKEVLHLFTCDIDHIILSGSHIITRGDPHQCLYRQTLQRKCFSCLHVA